MTSLPVDQSDASDADEIALAALLRDVQSATGIDFSAYRAATVRRRVLNRMMSVGIPTISQYHDYFRRTDGEPRALLERITIKVSRFFRSAETFRLLRNELIPSLKGDAGIRIWSAGCACGEEAYSLAMLLEESGVPGTVLATDIDARAIARAERGVYPGSALAEVPPDLRHQYFIEQKTDEFLISPAIRARVQYMTRDLFAGSPEGTQFDLVACRNVLIYLQRPVQERAVLLLRNAVRNGGFLLLGEAEWPAMPPPLPFETVNAKLRVFRVAREGAA